MRIPRPARFAAPHATVARSFARAAQTVLASALLATLGTGALRAQDAHAVDALAAACEKSPPDVAAACAACRLLVEQNEPWKLVAEAHRAARASRVAAADASSDPQRRERAKDTEPADAKKPTGHPKEELVARLLALAPRVPPRALPDFAEAIGSIAPWANAEQRALLEQASDAFDQRGAEVRAEDPELVAPLARAIARLFGRARLDASAPLESLLLPVREDWEYSRAAACEAIAARGAGAADAAGELVAFLEKREHPTGHTKHLGEYYKVDDAPEVAAARALLAVSDDEAHRALAQTRRLAHERTPAQRREAAQALVLLGPQRIALHANDLAAAAQSEKDLETLRETATALGMALPFAAAARAPLQQLAEHTDKGVRGRARRALAQAAPSTDTTPARDMPGRDR